MTNVEQTANVKRTGKVWKSEAPKPNYTSIGADLITLALKKQETKTGQLFMVATHGNELGALAHKIKAAKSDESIRKLCNEYVAATPEGAALVKRQQELVAMGKLKNKLQRREQETADGVLSASSILLQRSCDCWLGLQRLIDAECKYQFDRVQSTSGGNVWVLHIWRDTPDQREWLQINATQLRAAVSATFKQDTPTADIRVACSENATDKKGKANEEKAKGNGELIPASKLPAAFVNLDTSIARITKDNGKGIAAGPNAIHQMHMVWARIDALMTDKEKIAARKTFLAEADKAAKRSESAKQSIVAAMKGKKTHRGNRKSA